MITIIVPTLNHPELIERHLRYYDSVGFKGSIFIGDSSEGELAERTLAAIKKYENKLDLAYHWAPKIHDALCMQQMLDSIKTPYIIFNGDDDFNVPSAMEECMEFLDTNPDYSAVHGIGLIAVVEPTGTSQRLIGTSYYNQQVVEAETAAERLVYHYAHPAATGFTVQRLETLKTRYQWAHEMADRPFAGEWLPDSLTVALGKVKELDTFYLIRQIHPGRHVYPPVFDWISSEIWRESYNIYLDHMADVISEIDDIPHEEARTVVKQAFWDRLTKSMYKGIMTMNGEAEQSGLRRLAKSLPGVKGTYRNLKSRLPGEENAMTMEALLRPGSPYHDEFMPAYRTMIDPL